MTEIKFDFEHTHLDRSGWPAGEWDREPDHAEWRDPATGLPCMAHRNQMGAWCGYVAVPPEHPWHRLNYSECPQRCGDEWCFRHSPEAVVQVHGGLTYSDSCMEGKPAGEAICHIPKPGEPDNVWWFGFDCAHYRDVSPGVLRYSASYGDSVYRPLPYAVGECTSLAAQLAAVGSAS